MRITLNLATRPFADLGPAMKRLRIAMAVLALVAIGLGLGLRAIHQKAEQARARDHSLDGQIARVAQERKGYEDLMHQPDNAQLLTEVGVLNRLFDEKTFSWTLAMEDLETVLPGGVQVSTLEPVRAKDGHITLHLRVLGPRDKAIDLVRNLEHSRRFLLPRIVGENAETTTGGANERLEPVSASNRVNFDLLAEYNPAAPGERKQNRKPNAGVENAEGPLPGPVHGAGPVHASRPVPKPLIGLPQPTQMGRPPYTGPVRPPTARPNFNPAQRPAPGGPQ